MSCLPPPLYNLAVPERRTQSVERTAKAAARSRYNSLDLPYLRAGDLIYVAMAKGEGLDLITEDDKQYKRAKEAGVKAYRIDEYIDFLGSGG